MKKKFLPILLVISLVLLPLAAYADATNSGSMAGNMPGDSQSVTDNVYGEQSVSGDVYGPPALQDKIEKLKQELDNALSKNQMVRALRILEQLKLLNNQGKIDTRLETLKQELMNDVQNDDYDGALQVVKEILRIEHPQWAFKYLAQLYHMAGKSGRIHIFTNGNELQSDVQPIIKNGRTLVPLRAVANALGIGNQAIAWNQEDNTVTINNNNTVINLPVNSPQVTVNGQAQNIDVPAQMYNNRVMVPLRFISQVFKKPVNWYPEGQLVTVGE
ncbi:stalk domain-containing protein [Moorella naiadis]|uniref:copper amine oxidase N-terminal domain-containing protein n=1 Tax=Moorella naiadis (nom. illeg.) TaxID=3093670 RepID=UPI003D9CB404